MSSSGMPVTVRRWLLSFRGLREPRRSRRRTPGLPIATTSAVSAPTAAARIRPFEATAHGSGTFVVGPGARTGKACLSMPRRAPGGSRNRRSSRSGLRPVEGVVDDPPPDPSASQTRSALNTYDPPDATSFLDPSIATSLPDGYSKAPLTTNPPLVARALNLPRRRSGVISHTFSSRSSFSMNSLSCSAGGALRLVEGLGHHRPHAADPDRVLHEQGEVARRTPRRSALVSAASGLARGRRVETRRHGGLARRGRVRLRLVLGAAAGQRRRGEGQREGHSENTAPGRGSRPESCWRARRSLFLSSGHSFWLGATQGSGVLTRRCGRSAAC